MTYDSSDRFTNITDFWINSHSCTYDDLGQVTKGRRYSASVVVGKPVVHCYDDRDYSAHVNRWPSRDPIEERGGTNIYYFIGNDAVNSWDYLGLAGDTTHGTYACEKEDPCSYLAFKMRAWILNYAERQRELIQDKYNLKAMDPVRYNNHIDEARKSGRHVLNCMEILIKKIKKCECGDPPPKIPKFAPKPLPKYIEIPVSALPWWARGGKGVDTAIEVTGYTATVVGVTAGIVATAGTAGPVAAIAMTTFRSGAMTLARGTVMAAAAYSH